MSKMSKWSIFNMFDLGPTESKICLFMEYNCYSVKRAAICDAYSIPL